MCGIVTCGCAIVESADNELSFAEYSLFHRALLQKRPMFCVRVRLSTCVCGIVTCVCAIVAHSCGMIAHSLSALHMRWLR